MPSSLTGRCTVSNWKGKMNWKEMIPERWQEWIPVSHDDDAHRKVWHSANHKIYLGTGGDIYAFHFQAGPFSMTWETWETE